MDKPTIFIASSKESLPIARAVEQNLVDNFQVVLWTHAFKSGDGNLERLATEAHNYDFAAVILGADDTVCSRGKNQLAPRDNVLFELGLFIGAIGRDRTFFVFCLDQDLKIPSDFHGVTLCGYHKHTKGLKAAVSSACTEIIQCAERLGFRKRKPYLFNPHYDRDLTALDGKWKIKEIANEKTIVIVIGDHYVSELLDREAAGILREKIDSEVGSDRFKRAIILNYSSWRQSGDLARNPVIAIGGYEPANPLKKEIVEARRKAGSEPFPLPATGTRVGFGAYAYNPPNGPSVALWGELAHETRKTVIAWIDHPKGLKDFLQVSWRATPSGKS